jgi:hypothetical protein
MAQEQIKDIIIIIISLSLSSAGALVQPGPNGPSRMMRGFHKTPIGSHHSIRALFLPPNGSSRMLDRGLSRIFDVRTQGDARTQQ